MNYSVLITEDLSVLLLIEKQQTNAQYRDYVRFLRLLKEGQTRAKLTALACSEAPDGHSQWSLRLLANKVVELGYCQHLSHTQVGTILKKTSCNPISSGNGASAG